MRREGRLKKREERAQKGASKEIVAFVEKYRNEIDEGSCVLELGVGEGRNLVAFKGLKVKLYGIDLDLEAVTLCRTNLRNKGIHADISQGNFTNLSAFADESMTVLISQYAIQNACDMDEVYRIFSGAHRVLKANGLFFFREQKNPRHKDANRISRVAYFTEKEIQQIADRHGFKIIEGKTPIDYGADPDRVKGKRVTWNLVFQKKD